MADAAAKLKGLAVYATEHGDAFARIDAVAEVKGSLLALDLKSETIRVGLASVADDGVEAYFTEHGGNYS